MEGADQETWDCVVDGDAIHAAATTSGVNTNAAEDSVRINNRAGLAASADAATTAATDVSYTNHDAPAGDRARDDTATPATPRAGPAGDVDVAATTAVVSYTSLGARINLNNQANLGSQAGCDWAAIIISKAEPVSFISIIDAADRRLASHQWWWWWR